jgi:hypothetical protein
MQYVALLFLITTLCGGLWGAWQKIQLQEAQAEIQVLVIEKDAALASQAAAEAQTESALAQVQRFQQKMAEIEAEAARAQEAVTYTRNLFNDHDLHNLMQKKPGLIQRRMQDATDKVFSDLNAVTTQ